MPGTLSGHKIDGSCGPGQLHVRTWQPGAGRGLLMSARRVSLASGGHSIWAHQRPEDMVHPPSGIRPSGRCPNESGLGPACRTHCAPPP